MRVALGVVGLLALLAAAGGQTPQSNAPGGIRILYPADHTVLNGISRLVVAAPLTGKVTASLDGKPVTFHRMTFAASWVTPGRLKATSALIGERASTAVWASALKLSPGAHTLAVGGQRVEVRVLARAIPPGWTQAYVHQPVKAESGRLDCAGCHESEAGVIGPAPTPASCAPCHDENAVQLIHHHVAEPLAKCAMCHDPHGAARPKLLVDDKQKLCSKCHESGHFKG